jgi:hypothetical protein
MSLPAPVSAPEVDESHIWGAPESPFAIPLEVKWLSVRADSTVIQA